MRTFEHSIPHALIHIQGCFTVGTALETVKQFLFNRLFQLGRAQCFVLARRLTPFGLFLNTNQLRLLFLFEFDFAHLDEVLGNLGESLLGLVYNKVRPVY